MRPAGQRDGAAGDPGSGRGPAGERDVAATADPDRADDFQLDRDRIAALIAQALIIFVPCLLWFLYYNRQLSICGSVVPDSAGQCSGVVSRYLASLAGVIVSALAAGGAVAVLVVRIVRSRR